MVRENAAKSLAIAVDIHQARILQQKLAKSIAVVSFAPDAGHLLAKADFKVHSSHETLNWFGHARGVVLLKRIQQPVLDAFDQVQPVTRVERESLGHYLFQLISTFNVADRVLQPYRRLATEFVFLKGGKLCRVDNIDDAIFDIVLQLSPFPEIVEPGSKAEYSAFHGRLSLFLNRVLARRLRPYRTFAFLDHGNPLARKTAESFAGSPERDVFLQSRPPSRDILGTLRRFVKDWMKAGSGGGRPVFTALRASGNPPVSLPVLRLSGIHPMPVLLRRLIENVLPRCFRYIRREVEAGEQHMRIFGAHAIVGDHMFFAGRRAAAELQKKAGGAVIQVTHGTHTVPDGVISRQAALLWAEQGRLFTPDVTHMVVKTPGALKLARAFGAPMPDHIIRRNLYVRHAGNTDTDRPFTVVLGGNYQDLARTVPWQMETADEYQALIHRMIDEFARIPDCRLIIKMKPRKTEGMSYDAIEQKIVESGAADRIMIEENVKIPDLLGYTDLMICNMSTMADEALNCRIPVLLATALDHYFLWPAALNPPVADQRSAIYGLGKGVDVGAMIAGIRQAHFGKPLRDDEIDDLVWLEEDPVGPG